MSERQLRYRIGWVRKKPTSERLTAWNRAIGLVGVAFSAFFLVVGVVMIVQAL